MFQPFLYSTAQATLEKTLRTARGDAELHLLCPEPAGGVTHGGSGALGLDHVRGGLPRDGDAGGPQPELPAPSALALLGLRVAGSLGTF